MIIRDYYKTDIATAQIDMACRIFLAGEDYFSALTLAGAGEEILGKILFKRGHPNAVEKDAETFALIKEIHTGHKPDQKESRDVLNRARNEAKHFSVSGQDKDPIQVDPESEADGMIHRAISNDHMVTGTYTEQMLEFLDAVHRRQASSYFRP